MADPSEIDEAVVAKLAASVALMAIATDGVFFDVSTPGATKFVIISLVIGHDEYVMGEDDAAIQTRLYLVKYVEKTTSGANAKAAARHIHTALQKQPLTISGYTHMSTLRTEPVRATQADEDTDERWQHRGGRYEVMASSNG